MNTQENFKGIYCGSIQDKSCICHASWSAVYAHLNETRPLWSALKATSMLHAWKGMVQSVVGECLLQ